MTIQRFVDPAAMAASPFTSDEVDQLSIRFASCLQSRQEDECVEIASQLMLRGNHEPALEAFKLVGQNFPARGGLAATNAGASCFGLGRYDEAIVWYRKALELGAPQTIIDANILEAEQAKAGLATPPPPASSNVARRPNAEVIHNLVSHKTTKKIMLGDSIPEKKRKNMMDFVPSSERIVLALDLTLMGSAKDAIVFSDEWIFVRQMEEERQVRIADVGGMAKPLGVLHDKVGFRSVSGTDLDLPCGNFADLMVDLLNSLGANNTATREAATSPPASQEDRVKTGKALLIRGDFNGAAKLFLDEAKANPTHFEASILLMQALTGGGSYQTALHIPATLLAQHSPEALPLDSLVEAMAVTLFEFALRIEADGYPAAQIAEFDAAAEAYLRLPGARVAPMSGIQQGLANRAGSTEVFEAALLDELAPDTVEFPLSNLEPVSDAFIDLLNAMAPTMLERQLHVSSTFPEVFTEGYDIDLLRATLRLQQSGRVIPIQVLGTVAVENDETSWMWAWANRHLPEGSTELAREFQQVCAAAPAPELRTSKLPLNELQFELCGATLATVMAAMCDIAAIFVISEGDRHIYLGLVDNTLLEPPRQNPLAAIFARFPVMLQHSTIAFGHGSIAMPDPHASLSAYAESLGVSCTETSPGTFHLTWQGQSGQLRIIEDAQGVQVSGSIHPGRPN